MVEEGRKASYRIFSDFVFRKDDGSVDVTGLLSKECFKKWLLLREHPPRLPEESFRKTITSHCKGSPGMKPFSPDIEKEFLKLLRQRKVWPCFEDTDMRIGIRGCNLVGFWEALEIESVNALSSSSCKRGCHKVQIGIGAIEPLDNRYHHLMGLKGNLSNALIRFKQQPQPVLSVDIPFYSTNVFADNQRIYGELGMPLRANERWSSNSASSEIRTFLDRLLKLLTKQKQEGIEYSGCLQDLLNQFQVVLEKEGFVAESLRTVFEYMPETHLLMFLMSLHKATRFAPLYPTNKPQKNLIHDPGLRYFLSRDFFIPSSRERNFSHYKIKGSCLADFATYSIVDVDEGCKKIYRGDITGRLSIETRVHKFQSVQFLDEQLKELFSTGQAWTRTIEYRCDNTVMVLLNRYTVPNLQAHSTRVEHQDITERYVHLLQRYPRTVQICSTTKPGIKYKG